MRPGPQEWAVLQRTGRVSRIAQHSAPEELLAALARVLARLPEKGRLDRRLLAHDVTGDPHALDADTDLGGLVLAEAAACGAVEPGLHRRDAWARLGVDLDTLTGGLLSLNVHPLRLGRPPQPAAHPAALDTETLPLPKTSSIEVMRHVGTHGECRRGDRGGVCRGGRSRPDQ
ncbi:TIGR02679 domain-containing protein [Streptomyces sp. NBC_00842]|uniref:TIGR02679 domain-containing protein n=1 Tax=unclassified Streptomyces TaxID=2593676 RepID=UPI00386C85F1